MKNDKSSEKINLSKNTIKKLEELGKKEGKGIEELIEYLVDTQNKGKNRSGSTKSKIPKRNMDVNVDLSKIILTNMSELIPLLKRIAVSAENIEREHGKGWSDQRIDLGALVKKLDKLM